MACSTTFDLGWQTEVSVFMRKSKKYATALKKANLLTCNYYKILTQTQTNSNEFVARRKLTH